MTQQYRRERPRRPFRRVCVVALHVFWCIIAAVLLGFAIDAARKWIDAPLSPATSRTVSYLPVLYTEGLRCEHEPD